MFLVCGLTFKRKKKDSKYTNAFSVMVIQANKNKKGF